MNGDGTDDLMIYEGSAGAFTGKKLKLNSDIILSNERQEWLLRYQSKTYMGRKQRLSVAYTRKRTCFNKRNSNSKSGLERWLIILTSIRVIR